MAVSAPNNLNTEAEEKAWHQKMSDLPPQQLEQTTEQHRQDIQRLTADFDQRETGYRASRDMARNTNFFCGVLGGMSLCALFETIPGFIGSVLLGGISSFALPTTATAFIFGPYPLLINLLVIGGCKIGFNLSESFLDSSKQNRQKESESIALKRTRLAFLTTLCSRLAPSVSQQRGKDMPYPTTGALCLDQGAGHKNDASPAQTQTMEPPPPQHAANNRFRVTRRRPYGRRGKPAAATP